MDVSAKLTTLRRLFSGGWNFFTPAFFKSVRSRNILIWQQIRNAFVCHVSFPKDGLIIYIDSKKPGQFNVLFDPISGGAC